METGVDFSKAVKDYILEEFLPGENPDELTDDLPLISGGILDSIATLKLVLHFEEQYGIVLEAHEADKEHLDTIRSIASLLASKAR
ncbi:acyl carrier protein [Aromatoleum aromaticum]|uniref:Predicted acyl carrier protein n=1 Tax=Aromatoleum aromaticum (strain DSM 19018 / LMG 30748 / EbN1) TaxID=76114 RepID=Q5P290_AROAE|nr:acyl carrier protein [Aromatoleum aromaticum]NMG56201.1 acyl carrier protein [Aromatoleum aromaticum]CAI08574.1 predicted acyl carrier protein [Aromatoleum aromaticum EbN1]